MCGSAVIAYAWDKRSSVNAAPRDDQVLTCGSVARSASPSNNHSSQSRRRECLSKIPRVTGFVRTSLVWSAVSTNFTDTLSRWPTSSRISWYSASQCFDRSLSQCSSVSLIAICESHSMTVLPVCSMPNSLQVRRSHTHSRIASHSA